MLTLYANRESGHSYKVALFLALTGTPYKYVAVDLKHIPEGGSCRMDKGATIIRVGPGATPGTTRVRYAAPQLSSGGCPFLTVFELADADYASARAEFVRKEDDAKHTIEQLKKDLGDKWDEVTGIKK